MKLFRINRGLIAPPYRQWDRRIECLLLHIAAQPVTDAHIILIIQYIKGWRKGAHALAHGLIGLERMLFTGCISVSKWPSLQAYRRSHVNSGSNACHSVKWN